MGDINAVRDFAQSRMPSKPFHNFDHVRRVADVAKSMGSEPELLKVAAYLHDVGHANGADGHEERSARTAENRLPEWGYSEQEARRVADAIRDTVLFQKPTTKMGTVLSDADTHNFGLPFEEFKQISLMVKREEAPSASEMEWWSESVIPLLENHRYHGLGSRYSSQKKQNLDRLRQIVDEG